MAKKFRITYKKKRWAQLLPLADEEFDVVLSSPCFPAFEVPAKTRRRLGWKRHFMRWRRIRLIEVNG
jgi:hypothetical protein